MERSDYAAAREDDGDSRCTESCMQQDEEEDQK